MNDALVLFRVRSVSIEGKKWLLSVVASNGPILSNQFYQHLTVLSINMMSLI